MERKALKIKKGVIKLNLKDKKITISKTETVVNDNGFEEQTQVTVADNIWAYYRQASGSEFFAGAQVNAKVEAIFEINWRNDITTDMQILYKEKMYSITRLDDFEGNKLNIRITAYIIV